MVDRIIRTGNAAVAIAALAIVLAGAAPSHADDRGPRRVVDFGFGDSARQTMRLPGDDQGIGTSRIDDGRGNNFGFGPVSPYYPSTLYPYSRNDPRTPLFRYYCPDYQAHYPIGSDCPRPFVTIPGS